MAFTDFETADGRPIELLTFVNGTTTLRYTNANVTLTIDGKEYLTLEYTRNAPSISKDSDDSQLKLTMPSANPVINLYRNILQSTITTITVERFHDNDPVQQLQVFWKGEVGSVTVNNARATILATPLAQGSDQMPRFTYQGLCNYFLYESNTCKINKSDHRFVGTITSISGNGLQIQMDGLRTRAGVLDALITGSLTSDELDAYWLNGYVDAGGELRRIVRSPGGSSPESADTVEIPFPFINAQAGTDIIAYAGCPRDTDFCVRKFNNILNYGGFPTVPENVNPFETELPPGSRVNPPQSGGFW